MGAHHKFTYLQGYEKEGYEPGANSTLTPVAGKALFGVGVSQYETTYCISPDCASFQIYAEIYMTADGELVDSANDNGAISLAVTTGGLSKRVDSRATWDSEFENTYAEFNIPTLEDAAIKTPYLSQLKDANTEFMTGYTFTEEDWQKYDPEFGTTSPYVEPDGILTGGFIAGVTISSIIVAVAIFSYIYKRGVEAREKRVKAAIAMSIAKTMNFSGFSKNLSPSELATMFGKIDKDGNGRLSR